MSEVEEKKLREQKRLKSFISRYEVSFGNWPSRGKQDQYKHWLEILRQIPDAAMPALFRKVVSYQEGKNFLPKVPKFEAAWKEIAPEFGVTGKLFKHN